MINILTKYIVRALLILASFALLWSAFILGAKLVSAQSYKNLAKVAKSLPDYNGIAIDSGKQSTRECYKKPDQYTCNAVTIVIKDDEHASRNIKHFIENTAKQDIDWKDDATRIIWIDSLPFSRGDTKYQIYISHSSTKETTISLVDIGK